jgi:hypothetical protein
MSTSCSTTIAQLLSMTIAHVVTRAVIIMVVKAWIDCADDDVPSPE